MYFYIKAILKLKIIVTAFFPKNSQKIPKIFLLDISKFPKKKRWRRVLKITWPCKHYNTDMRL